MASEEGQISEEDIPKAAKRTLRLLVGLAHEAELGNALFGEFQAWKSGAIDAFELSDRIHKFHNGPNREIFLHYTSGLDPRFLVHRALKNGLIQKSAVPNEVRPYIEAYSNSIDATFNR